jgi:glutaconyl-CoA/methylmalonyl-CoA decarboxylase subunit delta
MSGETSAAIAMALHLYLEEAHDQENTILTIRRNPKNYAPWSSKIYSVLGLNKKFYRRAS